MESLQRNVQSHASMVEDAMEIINVDAPKVLLEIIVKSKSVIDFIWR